MANQLLLPDYYSDINNAYDRGRSLSLNDLAAKAYNTPAGQQRDALVGQAIGVDRNSGMQLGNDLQSMQDARDAKLGAAARYVLNAYQTGNPQATEGAYQAVKPFLSQIGMAHGSGQQPPDNFSPDMLPAIYQIVARTQGAVNMKTPAALQTFNAIQSQLPEDQRQLAAQVKAGTAPRATAPAVLGNQLIGPNGERGPLIVQKTGANAGQGSLVPLGGAPSLSQQSGSFFDQANDLAAKYGGTMTSGVRSPQHNAEVGGVPNSQHLTGTASDVVVPADQKQAFIEDAKARGLQPIDEGDHVHLQMPAGSTSTGVTGMRFAVGTPAPKESALENRLKNAKALGASDDELKGIALGNKTAATADQAGIDPDVVTNASWDYILNGKLPPIGRSGQGYALQMAVRKNAAEIAKQSGVSPQELATTTGRNKALQSSLTALQKRSDAMQAQEEAFQRNMNYALQVSDEISRTGSPALNKWVMGAKLNMGDPDVARLDAAIKPVAADYARIMSGATGSGGTPISTMEEAMSMLRKELSQKQFGAVADVLSNDIKNQQAAVEDQRQLIQGKMQQFGSPSQPSTTMTFTPDQQALLDKYR